MGNPNQLPFEFSLWDAILKSLLLEYANISGSEGLIFTEIRGENFTNFQVFNIKGRLSRFYFCNSQHHH